MHTTAQNSSFWPHGVRFQNSEWQREEFPVWKSTHLASVLNADLNPFGLAALLDTSVRHWHEIRGRLMKLNRNPPKDEKITLKRWYWERRKSSSQYIVLGQLVKHLDKICLLMYFTFYSCYVCLPLPFPSSFTEPCCSSSQKFLGSFLAFACPDRL